MTNSSNAMPGAFNFHPPHRDNGSAPRLSGAKSHIFQPPRTPSASASSSLILTRSTTSIVSTTTSVANTGQRPGVRKRTLNDYNDGVAVESPRMMDDWERENTGDRRWGGGEDWVPASPQPFVNTRYQLAGGMDTPTLAAAQFEHEGASEYSDVGYRKLLSEGEDNGVLRNTRRGLFGEHEGSNYFALEREANGRGRGYNSGQNGNGWSKGAISVVGAVVGKAWEFCKAGATVFTGFRAGGGQGYKVNNLDSASHFAAVENENNWESEKLDWTAGEREGTPVPGQFPDEDFIPDYMDNPTPEPSPMRPTKRRQISGSFRDEEIAKNWVVVSNQPTPATTPSKPQPRALSRPSMPTNGFNPRRSVAATSRPASRAGFGTAGARRPIISRGSHAGSPALQPNRGASFASSRSPASTSRIPRASPMREVRSIGADTDESPAAKEAKRWKALKKKEEREADESIRRLDAQLKAMIREGKEALGTKIEVDVEDDVGFGDTSGKRWAF